MLPSLIKGTIDKPGGKAVIINAQRHGHASVITGTDLAVHLLIVVGALTASYVTCSLPIQIVRDVYDATTGTTTSGVVIFNADDTLNSIFPKILPLLLTLGVYDLYAHKKWSPMKLMMLILVMALVLTGIGYLCGVYA